VVVGTLCTLQGAGWFLRRWLVVLDRDPLDWSVSSSEWERFCEYVHSEFGRLDGYLGREVERAMREYADQDDYADLEDRVNQLVEAAGRSPERGWKQKTSSLDADDTTRVQVRVEPEIIDAFREVVDAGDDTYGVALAKAIRVYRDGGRAARLERKLDRVLDDATAVLEEINPDESTDGLTAKQRKVITICTRLDDQFTDDELIAEIDDVAGHADRASDPTREKYRELVTDRLDVERHPNAPHVWILADEVEEIVPSDVPVECKRPASSLDREELVARIRYAAGRRAAETPSGSVRIGSTTILEDVLDEAVARKTALNLIEEAAFVPGFEADRSPDRVSLDVDLSALRDAGSAGDADSELFNAILRYRDSGAGPLITGPTETKVSDFRRNPGDNKLDRGKWRVKPYEQTGASSTAADGGGPRRRDRDDGGGGG
jgi:hypothetical protein